ncbi:MAG: ATP-dependent Lon protease [Actinomycetota bacterium]|jgi:ATP-dependent Lon protease|nr:ATP-dependent Lon protease [Actinomycetota bacterium]
MPELQTTTLPLMPLTTGVILPGMVVTLTADTDEAKAAVAAAERGDGRLLLVPFIDGRYARTGTIGKIENAGDLPGGIRGLIIRGIERATVGAGVATGGTALLVQADPIAVPPYGPKAHELAREYRAIVETIFDKKGVSHLNEHLRGISDPGQMADTSGYAPELTLEQKVEVLETVDVEQRLEKVLAWMHDVLADITLKERIHNDVNEGMEKTQREFILRQQMAAIRKELGESGDGEDVIEEYRAKVAGENVPEHVRKAVDKELGRLERTSEQNPEHGWIRGWLDTVTELPWGTKSDDHLDVADARVILDEDHTGLNDVKDRIVEYLAVRKLRADRGLGAVVGRSSGAIIALVGPPGVGKTSLGESVARALGRKFVRVSLGGVSDEAEIRGHRRTYVGAQPGRIVRALREAGTMNPVFLLDEVDKLGSDWRGNPSSALLEVLDPAQNHTFRDHYLEIDLDLSDVLFVATANQLDTIPGPLLDRMEIISLDGYTDDEKVTIARDHLLARQLERNGLAGTGKPGDEVSVTDDALRSIVSGYTREAGVRNLERELGKTLRKVATKVAGGDIQPPVAIDEADVKTWLGRQKFFFEAADRTAVPGVATGLAVTGMGGDVLFIEASALPSAEDNHGGGALTITGQLGDVMKESAQIALSYVRSHADDLGIPLADRVHLHVPAGAIPKDGPSAGVTMVSALVSLMSGRPLKSSVGMTGEVTLQGRVLPIGGVKQKVLAASRAGLKEVILPMRNGPDLDDVPQAVKDVMTFHLVEDVKEVLELALEPVPAEVAAA